MAKDFDPVELRHAYAWTCPRCERRNVVEAYVDMIEGTERTQIDDSGNEFNYASYEAGPVHDGVVICQNCDTNFEVKEPEPLF